MGEGADRQVSRRGGRRSAVIPLLWRAQEQEGWVTKPAIEEIARMLGHGLYPGAGGRDLLLHVPAATHGQRLRMCRSAARRRCMICGAEELIEVCKRKIAPHAHELSADGKFTWEEVECLGRLRQRADGADRQGLLRGSDGGGVRGHPRRLRAGRGAAAGAAERALRLGAAGRADVAERRGAGERGERVGDAGGAAGRHGGADHRQRAVAADGDRRERRGGRGSTGSERSDHGPAVTPARPAGLAAPRGAGPDDLKLIKGVGPVLEDMLHRLGYFHFFQIAAWTPGGGRLGRREPRGFSRARHPRGLGRAGAGAGGGGRHAPRPGADQGRVTGTGALEDRKMAGSHVRGAAFSGRW